MGIPESTIVAAERWLVELSLRDFSGARLILRSAPDYRDLTPTQYEIALDWLRACGLVLADGRLSQPSAVPGLLVFDAAIEQEAPPWLMDADVLVLESADLPIDALNLAAALRLAEEDVFDHVQAVWRKFDDRLQRELGAAGEVAMIEWLSERVSSEIVHVSSYDDTAGYDIELRDGSRVQARVEVKATRKLDAIVLFLSRNEYNTMLRHDSWCLQVVGLDAQDNMRSLAWLRREDIQAWAPTDASLGAWQSMKLTVSANLLQKGAAPQVSSAQFGG
jgi:hypothetical protein